jgi:hypothetical protein
MELIFERWLSILFGCIRLTPDADCRARAENDEEKQCELRAIADEADEDNRHVKVAEPADNKEERFHSPPTSSMRGRSL